MDAMLVFRLGHGVTLGGAYEVPANLRTASGTTAVLCTSKIAHLSGSPVPALRCRLAGMTMAGV